MEPRLAGHAVVLCQNNARPDGMDRQMAGGVPLGAMLGGNMDGTMKKRGNRISQLLQSGNGTWWNGLRASGKFNE